MMKIIGLTGSIASGKSTVAKWIKELGFATHDADLVVHELLAPHGRAVAKVLDVFGSHLGSLSMGVNRKLLGEESFAASHKRRHLESILHPMVREHRDIFISQQRSAAASAAILDVPLLFETKGDIICDYIIVVYASAKSTVDRALARPGMTQKKLRYILASQIPTEDKIRWADLALDSDLSKAETRKLLIDWISKVGLPIFMTKHSKP